jgi:hypothetical protein
LSGERKVGGGKEKGGGPPMLSGEKDKPSGPPVLSGEKAVDSGKGGAKKEPASKGPAQAQQTAGKPVFTEQGALCVCVCCC